MPNAAHRITETTINAMSLMLFTLNCFNLSAKLDTSNHPKLIVIFNDVSKYGQKYDPLSVGLEDQVQPQKAKKDVNKRIEEYKTQLKEKVKKFILHLEISEEINFGNKSWRERKVEVLESEGYKIK